MVAPVQRRLSPKRSRSCVVCSGSVDLLSLNGSMYAKGSPMKAAHPVVICEPCFVAAALDATPTKRRRVVCDVLLAEFLRIYKTVRGVS
jgi:hypothetical protein